jgi:hypothetical protein
MEGCWGVLGWGRTRPSWWGVGGLGGWGVPGGGEGEAYRVGGPWREGLCPWTRCVHVTPVNGGPGLGDKGVRAVRSKAPAAPHGPPTAAAAPPPLQRLGMTSHYSVFEEMFVGY